MRMQQSGLSCRLGAGNTSGLKQDGQKADPLSPPFPVGTERVQCAGAALPLGGTLLLMGASPCSMGTQSCLSPVTCTQLPPGQDL